MYFFAKYFSPKVGKVSKDERKEKEYEIMLHKKTRRLIT